MSKVLRVLDIATQDVLFYDEEFEENCYRFCRKRDIDCLPSLEHGDRIHVRDDSRKGFIDAVLAGERRIDGSRRLFHPEVLESFRKNHLLFVYSGEDLAGVVHFSDFNKSTVSIYLYELLFQYERNLRIFLQACGLTNADMKKYFQLKIAEAREPKSKDYYQRKLRRYTSSQSKNDRLPPFQSFYLDELVGLAKSRGSTLKTNVVELRNMIMHAHELVNKQDWTADNYIFDFETFEEFFTRALALHADCRKIKNKVAFLLGFDEVVSFE